MVIEVALVDGVADVRLSRAVRHNALNLAMFERMREVQEELRADAAVRAIVLSGAGPSFCSGLDTRAAAAGELDFETLLGRPGDEVANLAQTASFGWRSQPAPVIAAIHGACFGGGLQIALGADIRIVDPDARLSIMEVELGLVPDMAISTALPGSVREDVAKELAFTGRIAGGAEARELGLATRVATDPRRGALELAAEIAARSPDAVRAIKQLFTASWGPAPEDTLASETELARTLLGSPNQLEALRAKLTGEAPRFADPGQPR